VCVDEVIVVKSLGKVSKRLRSQIKEDDNFTYKNALTMVLVLASPPIEEEGIVEAG